MLNQKNAEATCGNLRVATSEEANAYKEEFSQELNMICTNNGKYIHPNGNEYDRSGYLLTACYAFTCMLVPNRNVSSFFRESILKSYDQRGGRNDEY